MEGVFKSSLIAEKNPVITALLAIRGGVLCKVFPRVSFVNAPSFLWLMKFSILSSVNGSTVTSNSVFPEFFVACTIIQWKMSKEKVSGKSKIPKIIWCDNKIFLLIVLKFFPNFRNLSSYNINKEIKQRKITFNIEAFLIL